jgi:hypothetical protein
MTSRTYLHSCNGAHPIQHFYEKVIKVKADVAALHCLISVLVAFGTSGPSSLRLLFLLAFATFPEKILG